MLWLTLGLAFNAYNQSIKLGLDYYHHNLNSEAKILFIKLLNSNESTDDLKAEVLFWLGQISYEEGNYSTAFNDWEMLVSTYPQSSFANEIGEQLNQLREVLTRVTDIEFSNAIASSYLKNGDFWSEAGTKFLIDGSWFPKIELSIEWYDRVINEFPGSKAAELAYRKKIFTLLGWEDPGQYGAKHGAKKSFSTYIPLVIETFNEFEAAFPESSYLQGFRYQIAQEYWRNKKWDGTRTWLQKVLDSSGGKETFYTQSAKARLNKIEY